MFARIILSTCNGIELSESIPKIDGVITYYTIISCVIIIVFHIIFSNCEKNVKITGFSGFTLVVRAYTLYR